MTETVEFRVPATSAHLGPGYGVVGLALDRSLHIRVEPSDDERHVVERRGSTADMPDDSRHDEILRGLHAAAERFAIKLPPGLRIEATSDIPPACGLGTHAAQFAAGIGAAARFADSPPSADEAHELLVRLGGDAAHGAAALCGGLTAVAQISEPAQPLRFRVLRLPLHDAWWFVVTWPEVRISTSDLHRVLPPTLPHAVLQRTSGRLLGMLSCLGSGDETDLSAFLRDEVHVPFRRRLVPGLDRAIHAGREAGAAGVTISGAGPGLVAMTTDASRLEDIGAAMAEELSKAGSKASTLVLHASEHGALPD